MAFTFLAGLLMTAALLVGVGLGLVPQTAEVAVKPVHAIAIGTAAIVVLLNLLPEAVRSAGNGVLVAFGVALAAPFVVERVVRDREARFDVSLEIGFLGLLAHQLWRGLSIPAHAAELEAGTASSFEILFDGVYKCGPIMALLVIAYARRGPRTTWVRSFIAIGVTLLGIPLGAAAQPDDVAALAPWLAACVAGIMLHVVVRDWSQPKKKKRRARHAVARRQQSQSR